MRNTHVRFSLALAAALSVLATGLAVAQQEKTPQQMHEEMMAVYMKAAQPGPQHERLARNAGEWNVTVRSWTDPQGEPMVSQGSEQAHMVLGGRFLASNFKGQMMGMPFEGYGLIGYDNLKGKYVGVWLDSMGTGMMNYEGEYDEQKKALVCHGDFIDAATGTTQQATLVSREVSPDQHVFEMWSPGPDGQPVKWMEMEYRRAD